MPRRSILLFAAVCSLLAVGIAVATILVVSGRERAMDQTAEGAGVGTPSVGGPFQLVDQDGHAVDESLLEGKWSLVFFGFTYCPDYCPTTLNALEATRTRLGTAGEDLQILFITVDPERDTPSSLKAYLSSEGFPDGVIGLTGEPDQVAEAARVYRAHYSRVGEGEHYVMNHTLTLYLMGPDGRFRSALSHDLGPERSAQLIRRVMARG